MRQRRRHKRIRRPDEKRIPREQLIPAFRHRPAARRHAEREQKPPAPANVTKTIIGFAIFRGAHASRVLRLASRQTQV